MHAGIKGWSLWQRVLPTLAAWWSARRRDRLHVVSNQSGGDVVAELRDAAASPAPPHTHSQSQAHPVPPSAEPVAAAGGWRVLVVDDNIDAAHTLALLLEITGHVVAMAHDGLEALSQAERFRPDVVLLDIGLPRLDGHEVARRLRQQDWGRNVVLVALTGWGQAPVREASVAAGFDAHLVKPVEHEVLMARLQALMTRRSARRQPPAGELAGPWR